MGIDKVAGEHLRKVAANTARDIALALRLASQRMENFEPGQGKDAVREVAEQLYASARRAVRLYYQETLTQAVAQREGPARLRRTGDAGQPVPARRSADLREFRSEIAGCYNQIGFELLVESELERARRRKSSLAAALFKAEPPNPDLVARVAGHARESCRLLDVLAVFDNGLGLLLPDTGREGAQVAALRVLSSYQSMRDLGDGPKAESLSVGLAAYPDDGADPTELLRLADARAQGPPLLVFEHSGSDR